MTTEPSPMYEYASIAVRGECPTSEHTRGLFKKKVEVEEDQRLVDPEDFALRISQRCNELSADGFDVISIIPVQEGRTKNGWDASRPWGAGYGFTRSVVITARRDRSAS